MGNFVYYFFEDVFIHVLSTDLFWWLKAFQKKLPIQIEVKIEKKSKTLYFEESQEVVNKWINKIFKNCH